LSLLTILPLMACDVLPTEPEPYLRIGVLTPDTTIIFFAQVEPKDSLFWRLEWTWGQMEGCEPAYGSVAVEMNYRDDLFKWVARAGNYSDSLYWPRR
jgi:hypothetical protein